MLCEINYYEQKCETVHRDMESNGATNAHLSVTHGLTFLPSFLCQRYI